MRDVVFVGSSRDDLRAFPDEARREAGFALETVQHGEKPDNAKPLGASAARACKRSPPMTGTEHFASCTR